MAFLTEIELKSLGFKSLGKNVKISNKASIFAPHKICIGSNVRIDDFCVLSAAGGYITLHNHIHIAVFCSLNGKGGIEMFDYSGLSSRVSLYSASDDYSGDYLIGPIMEDNCLNIIEGPIILEKYVTVGTNSTILPNTTLKEGSILGSFSLLTRDTEEWTINAGVTAKKIKHRNKGLLELVKIMEAKWN